MELRGIRDCIYGSDAEFSVIMKWDLGNCNLKAPRSGIPDGENFTLILTTPSLKKSWIRPCGLTGDRRNIEDTGACYSGYNNITTRLGHHNVM